MNLREREIQKSEDLFQGLNFDTRSHYRGNTRGRSLESDRNMEADNSILELPSVDFKQRENLPTVSGIYYVIDEKNVVWYIGQAKNIYARWQGKSHHRKFQLDSQKKKHFQIYYRLVNVDSLDEIERQEITRYSPHLNQSSVKRKKVRPTETLLRETLVKLSDYLVVLGIEPPRKLDVSLCESCRNYREDWWIQKQVLGLEIIHVSIDWNKLNQLVSEYEHITGILNSAFVSRKAYASKWAVPPGTKNNPYIGTYESARLLVNNYVIEVSTLHNPENWFENVEKSILAGERINVLKEKSFLEIKERASKSYGGIFLLNKERIEEFNKRPGRRIISRLQPYQSDPIKLVFKEELNYPELREYITKTKEEYEKGLRGFGSRSKPIEGESISPDPIEPAIEL